MELQLFEKDVQKVHEWLISNRERFLGNHSTIGRKTSETKSLQEQHEYFTSGCMKIYSNLQELQEVGNRLIQQQSVIGNQYNVAKITTLTSRLNRSWMEFKASLDERTLVLSLAHGYFQTCESFVRSCPSWLRDLEVDQPLQPSQSTQQDINRLEELVHLNQSMFHTINSYYKEVHSCKDKLEKQLIHFLKYCHQCQLPSSSASSPPDDIPGEVSMHISVTIEDVMRGYRHLEKVWQSKKMKLHQRLALALFQDDCRQVLEWITVHGEGFLKKNLTTGKNLERARALQKSHQHFESVAANTYTNGAKLLAAAEEFANTGECNPEEIFRVARQLESRVRSFAEKVERRRQVLNLAVMFFTHERDIFSCIEDLRNEVSNDQPIEAPPTVDACVIALDSVSLQREQVGEAINNTISEGQTLIQVLKDLLATLDRETQQQQMQQQQPQSGSSTASPGNTSTAQRNARHGLTSALTAIEATVDKLTRSRPEVDDLFNNRKLKMELCLQLRLFERDALSVCNTFEGFTEEIDCAQRKDDMIMSSQNSSLKKSSSHSHHGHHHSSYSSSNHLPSSIDVPTAEKNLELHNENFSRVQQMAYDFFQRGQDLSHVSLP